MIKLFPVRRHRSTDPQSACPDCTVAAFWERTLAEEFPECHGSKESTRPVAGGQTEIVFCCTEPELKVYEELKDLWGHKNHERSWQVLFADVGFDALKRHKAAMAKMDIEKVGTPREMPYHEARTRYRSVHVKRLVWARAGSRCRCPTY